MDEQRKRKLKNSANEAKRNLCAAFVQTEEVLLYSPAKVQRNEQNIFIKVEIME